MCAAVVAGARFCARLAHLDLADFPELKQLTISPQELKVTLRCARGERQMYRVLRAAQFPPDCVSPHLVAESLAVARATQEVLAAEQEAG